MEILRSLLGRRSIRRFQDKAVDDRLLDELLSIACRVATTNNMQLYSVIVTRDETRKRELAPAHLFQPSLQSAPVVLTFCADFNRFTKWCLQRKAHPGYGYFQSFMSAVLDTALVTQQFCTAAESQGLGCCYLGTTTFNAGMIIDILELPELVVPVATIVTGYPAEFPEQVDRLPLEAVVHHERYKDYTPEAIDRYYMSKEFLPQNIEFVEENHKETLAQVYTEVRYTEENARLFSQKFLHVLRQQGFMGWDDRE